MPKLPTIRSLARQLRLSGATVSEGLRDSPRVSPATRERIRRAAEKAGYKVNPLLSAALSAMRQGQHRNFRGTLALVDTTDRDKAQLILFHREIVAGAERRAQSLGFNTELFWIGDKPPALAVTRLMSVLYSRGIGGAVLLPFNPAQDFSRFDFSRFSVVQMDHSLVRPQLNMILPDHYISMMHALEHLTQRGYQRIGLCLDQHKDLILKNKWSAGFMSFVRNYAQNSGIPALILPGLTRKRFIEWFHENHPDLVIAHLQITVDWMKSIGIRVPEDIGYFNLNYTERIGPCAGLDLQPRRLGAAAVETVVGMMHRQERGVPEHPQTITLEAAWVEGPTVRPG